MTILKEKFLFNIIIVCLCLVFTASCAKSIKCPLPPAPDVKDSISDPTANLLIDVFLDSTLSMQGFIGDGSLSYYQQSIPMLERAVIKNGGQAAFYKFGTDIRDLPNRSYGDADKKIFYADNSINKNTLIEKVIDRADPNRLTIIVSDLFQEKSDINQLSEKIKTKFINNDLAIGLLGIKSQFSGKIYDVGTNNYSFNYSSSNEPLSQRPFYLLALGRRSDIARYFETLLAGEMFGFPNKQSLIFSRQLTKELSSFKESKIVDSRNANEVSGVLVQAERENQFYKEFKLKNKTDKATISVEMPFQPLPNTVDFNRLQPETQAFTCASGDKTVAEQNAATVLPNSEVIAALQINTDLAVKDKININFDIDPSKMNPKTVCGYHVIFRPISYAMPAWTSEWNMSGDQVEVWHNSPASFDGSKTYNLASFLQTLWETNRQVHNPEVADFYIYFRIG